MTKAERLFSLLDFIRKAGPVSLEDLTAEFRVSTRTIYRDLNSLLKLNIPITYKNGYRLGGSAGLPVSSFSDTDREFILYALQHNPLAEQPQFAPRFGHIASQLNGLLNPGESNGHILEYDRTIERNDMPDEYDALSVFVAAFSNKKMLMIHAPGHRLDAAMVRPVAIRIANNKPSLVVTYPDSNGQLEIPVASIQRLELAASPVGA